MLHYLNVVLLEYSFSTEIFLLILIVLLEPRNIVEECLFKPSIKDFELGRLSVKEKPHITTLREGRCLPIEIESASKDGQ
jgi:hypothetical protein